jgi:hypothetical protein
MSKVVLISVAAAVGFGLLSVHLLNRLKAGEATIADLQAQITALKQQPRQLPPPPPEASPPPEAIAPRSSAVGTPPKEAPKGAFAMVPNPASVAPPSREERMRIFRESRERQRQLMQDPEYREAMRVQARGNFARQYPGVIQELGLDAQQADEFFDLLADQQLRATELMQPVWEMEGVDNGDPAAMQERQAKIQQLAQQNQRKTEAEMAAFLGQQKLQAWKDYQSSMGMRYELENMRNTLASTGMPLSDDMSKPMLKALAQASQAEADEYTAAANRGAAPAVGRFGPSVGFDSNNMERQLETMKKRNQRMLDAISPYLSFEQRAAIEKQQEAQLKMQEAQLRLMRAQGKAENSAVYFIEGSGTTVARP